MHRHSVMRRSIVISICLFNAVLASALLWYTFGAKKRTQAPISSPTIADEALDDTHRWQLAQDAVEHAKALFYLNQIEDEALLQEKLDEAIQSLLITGGAPFRQWPFYQAALQVAAQKTQTLKQLHPIRELAKSQSLALTLRDTAFRVYLENYLRLREDADSMEPALTLIDQLYLEANSLSQTSLQAEYYLHQNGLQSAARITWFVTRLQTDLSSTQKAEATRKIALSILEAMGQTASISFEEIYFNSGLALQTRILETIARMQTIEYSSWLVELEPTTPEQEQLLQRILQAR